MNTEVRKQKHAVYLVNIYITCILFKSIRKYIKIRSPIKSLYQKFQNLGEKILPEKQTKTLISQLETLIVQKEQWHESKEHQTVSQIKNIPY